MEKNSKTTLQLPSNFREAAVVNTKLKSTRVGLMSGLRASVEMNEILK